MNIQPTRYLDTKHYALIIWMIFSLCSGHLSSQASGNAVVQSSGLTSFYTPLRSAEAYTQAIPQLDSSALERFYEGRNLFRQVWTDQPPSESRFSGLGPLYNRFSCIACHPGNGRGFAPDNAEQSMKTMLVRLSINDHQQGPIPHPFYGEQLNEFGTHGVPGEGEARIHYTTHHIILADGEVVTLRRPQLIFTQLAYGPIGDTLTSARIAPPVFGMGLIDNIPDTEILRLAEQVKPAGITGHPNYVWDVETHKTVIGKFGWKANIPHLRQQIASAFAGDLGITSALYPTQNCTSLQRDCLQAIQDSGPELSGTQLDTITFYLSVLAVPYPETQSSRRHFGADLFKKALCIVCHTDQLKTGKQSTLSGLNQQWISPYSDLLLHDMGEGLADHRPDFKATGREWRTAPLWGIGLAKTVQSKAGFLHDGRAKTLTEAILWHDGEAKEAARIFSSFNKDERETLILFLESL